MIGLIGPAITYLLNPFLLYLAVSVSFFFIIYFDHFTDGRTPWTSDQLVAKSLPKDWTTQTQNEHIHIPNIYTLCGSRTHDPGFQASEDISCLRQLGYRDRHYKYNYS
jgi:hypothetical protein